MFFFLQENISQGYKYVCAKWVNDLPSRFMRFIQRNCCVQFQLLLCAF